ncbi:MAG: 2-hydroxyacyl-CoA dehydratase [Chloroflexi bacterium]|nr:2-hydroxyacyl-CoA dehydratase [Chloroflexota bacterium]
MATPIESRVAPLETYRWAKEMRLRGLKEVLQAGDEGRLLAVGNQNAAKELLAGIGDFAFMGGEAWAVAVTREGQEKLALQAVEEMERRGYARDMCAFTRLFCGAMFVGHTPFGPFPRPALVLATNQCDSKGKWFQVVGEHLGIPYYCIDYVAAGEEGSLKLSEHSVDYLVSQFEEFIDWLKRFTGRPYDDDRLTRAIANTYQVRSLWSEVMKLQAAVPAPLDYRLLLPFFLVLEYWSHTEEAVRLFYAFRDEVAHRVANGITPLPRERFRVVHENMPVWYALYLFRYLRDHGVAVLGGSNHFRHLATVQPLRPDGLFDPQAPVLSTPPRTRPDALRFRAIATLHAEKYTMDTACRIKFVEGALQTWKANGAIFLQDRGCELISLGALEVKAALSRQGIPTMLYETNRADKREWSWGHVADTMDAFLESIGVPRSEIRGGLASMAGPSAED